MKNTDLTTRDERILYFTFEHEKAAQAAERTERILKERSGNDYGYRVEARRAPGLENATEVVISWNRRHVGGDPLLEALTLMVEAQETAA